MKTPEDEAFDDLARKQGAWGGGFPAKKAMAADKYSDIVSDGGLDPRNKMDAQPVQEDLINYGTAWSQDGKRIDPMSVYKEPVTEREALKLALEALEADELDMVDDGSGNTVFRKEQSITAIKAALAQPAQEPVKCAVRDCQNHMHEGQFVGPVCFPCYTTPPRREWNAALDEAAARIGEIKGFGQATHVCFAVYIKGLKK